MRLLFLAYFLTLATAFSPSDLPPDQDLCLLSCVNSSLPSASSSAAACGYGLIILCSHREPPGFYESLMSCMASSCSGNGPDLWEGLCSNHQGPLACPGILPGRDTDEMHSSLSLAGAAGWAAAATGGGGSLTLTAVAKTVATATANTVTSAPSVPQAGAVQTGSPTALPENAGIALVPAAALAVVGILTGVLLV